MTLYCDEIHDEERAFYGISHAKLQNCTFAGSADGESALKETADIEIEQCNFLLRYPLWHTDRATILECSMTETCRAALWYDRDIKVKHSTLGGIKALRECTGICLENCKINSTEFGWFCHDVRIKDCELTSEYPFLQCTNMEIDGFKMNAKYSFQYVKNVTLRGCELHTKDAFWHSKNVTVYDSVVTGEYLGWYSENLRLVRCKITGTQPLCYAKGLVLEDCEMIDCDLSFENSAVTATVSGEIMSVKNPVSGRITADRIGEIILENKDNSACEIVTTEPCLCV